MSRDDRARARRVVADRASMYGARMGRESALRYLAEADLSLALTADLPYPVLHRVADALVPEQFDIAQADRRRLEREQRLQQEGRQALESYIEGAQGPQETRAAWATLSALAAEDPDFVLRETGGFRDPLHRWRDTLGERLQRVQPEEPDSSLVLDQPAVQNVSGAPAPDLPGRVSVDLPEQGSPEQDSPPVVRTAQGASGSRRLAGGARVRDNLAALRLSLELEDEGRAPTAQEREVLDGWRSWGAVPALFDPSRSEFESAREELLDLVGPAGFAAARRTTINAHYTDPAIVAPMWRLLNDVGLEQGHTVLEPGCGAGGFFDAAPQGVRLLGVELDPTTARIAAQRHPGAEIRTESFADTSLPEGFADAVIGNVPFAEVALYDPTHNPGRGLSMHNHFLFKSLALTAPGGVVVALTSRYTLDARSSFAREQLYGLGDLLGAVRLPSGAHAKWAGTDVVTDLVVLRRRGLLEAPGDDSWLTATPSAELSGLALNDYWRQNPQRVLGQMVVGQGMHGSTTLEVHAGDGAVLGEVLDEQLIEVADRARAVLDLEPGQMVLSTDPQRQLVAPTRRVARTADPTQAIGFMSAAEDGTIMRRSSTGELEPAPVPQSAQAEMRALLGLRDTVLEMLSAQAANELDTPEMDAQRRVLATRYEAYVARYGPINRYSVSVRQPRKEGDKPIEARRIPTAVRVLAQDPYAATVKALELFDDTTQTATPAAVFTRRVVAPRTPAVSAGSPADALAICLDTHGRVELEHIASLLDVSQEQAREQLGALVFRDPDIDQLVPAQEYLSGNVRAKLAVARDAAEADPALRANVEALTAVVPTDLGPEEIKVRLGAVWVPAETVQEFMREILDDDRAEVSHDGGSNWEVTAFRHSVAASQEWGTQRRPAPDLAESLATGRRIVVEDKITVGDQERVVLNVAETAAAQEKAAALNERFGEWVWEDPARAAALAARYNELFNSIVLRSYDDTEHMTFPGLAANFEPRPHQRAAVARMIQEPTVGLFHEVGAGKTAEMVIGCMELRRLALVQKPAIVVPNHMLEQFSREFLQLYPSAQVLAASTEDLSGDKRREFVARCALGDWDAVILTMGAFQRIPVSAEAEANYVMSAAQSEHARLESARDRGSERSVKQAEKAIARAEEKAKSRLQVQRDPGITWEQTGIDYLCVDEAHLFKNLAVESTDRSLAVGGSQRAADLDLKVGMLRERAGVRGRVLTAATATPIANNISEMWTMQNYLRPDLLRAAGITDFDSWAVTFGQSVTDMELDPAGSGYRLKTRFARFQNVPELLRMWSVAADVKTAEDLGLPTPELSIREDGTRGPRTVVVQATSATAKYVANLGDRAERVRAGGMDSKDDNMLLITNDGRAAALDLRLVSARFPPEQLNSPWDDTKITVAADHIALEWEAHREDVFLDETGAAHPIRGGLQIVFCDLGTPRDKEEQFSVYSELRNELAARGMDPARVRFIHEAKNDAEKARLFAACRTGQVDVIIGSTEKMGIGTNIQSRAVALHHLDCPWRPADIAQREGRIVRQGNQNAEITLYRYITARTFDAYSWQTVERKSIFINQVLKGSLDAREIEDIGDEALSFAEVKALAADNPHAMARAQAQAEVTRLERAESAHHRGQSTLAFTASQLEGRIEGLQGDIQRLEALPAAIDTRGEAFRMRVDGQGHSKRVEAGEQLTALVAGAPATVSPYSSRVQEGVVNVGGMDFDLHVSRADHRSTPQVSFRASGAPELIRVDVDMRYTVSGSGTVTRLENASASGPHVLGRTRTELENAERELDRARANIGRPFQHAQALTDARAALADVEAQISEHLESRKPAEACPAEQLVPILEAVAARLPGAVREGEAIEFAGQRWAPADHSEHEPVAGAELGFWGHPNAEGQPVTGPLRWDSPPEAVAKWIERTAPPPPRAAVTSPARTAGPSASSYGYGSGAGAATQRWDQNQPPRRSR
ncbi:MAG: helicase [Micrococcus sp.]|nr:helicase [Micrococcus sp.]